MAQSTISVPLNQFDISQSVLDSHFLRTGPTLPSPKPVPLPASNPTKSFWTDSPGANPLAAEGSTGDLTPDADICIIGGGITGVSAAYHLARNLATTASNRTVVILEARDFCSGATGRNGGHLTPSIFLDFYRRQSLYGTEAAVKTYELENHTSRELVKIIQGEEVSRFEDETTDVDLVEGGHTTLFVTQAEEDTARRDFGSAKAAGLSRLDEVKWIDRETMNKTRGVSFPGVQMPGHNLWPLKLVTRLFKLAEGHSSHVKVKLHTRTPVTAITRLEPEGGHRRYKVATPRGSLTCSYILHATNGYVNSLLSPEETNVRVVPTRGQMVGVRASAGEDRIGRSSWDANEGFEYWFPRPIKERESEGPLVILGGGREVSGPRFEYYETDDGKLNESVGSTLRDFLPSLFPRLYEKKAKVDWEWTGIMGYTQSGNPFVGPVLPASSLSSNHKPELSGQYVAAGYTGHGMPRGYACAELVAGMMTADICGRSWSKPTWAPDHYLTVLPQPQD